MSFPLTINLENNQSGLTLNNVVGAYVGGTPPTVDSKFLIDRDQDLTVTVSWDTAGSDPGTVLLLSGAAQWVGKAVMHATDLSGTTSEASGVPVAFVDGAASVSYTFPAGTLDSGLYELYVSLGLQHAVSGLNLRVNMMGAGDVLSVFDAI